MAAGGFGFGSKPPRRPRRNWEHAEAPLPDILIGTANLFDYLDKKVLVVLRDKRTLLGMFRTFDQFNNLVLHQAVERIHVGSQFGDIPRGVFIIRGENVELIGEIDEEKEARSLSQLTQVPVNVILGAQREAEEEKARKEAVRIESLKQRGIPYPRLREAGINDDHF